jgi:hydroxylamine reductase
MITKDQTMGEILNMEKGDEYAGVLMGCGMHCVGCPSSIMETLEEASEVHDCDLELLLETLNKAK